MRPTGDPKAVSVDVRFQLVGANAGSIAPILHCKLWS